MRKMILFSMIAMTVVAFQSCKKSTAFTQGQINFKADGSVVNCTLGVVGQFTIGNTVTLSGTSQSGITVKSINIVVGDAVVGENNNTSGDDKHVVFTYSSMADTYASHWNDILVGSAVINFEILSATEAKATFSGSVKKQDGSGTIQITEGKAWVTY